MQRVPLRGVLLSTVLAVSLAAQSGPGLPQRFYDASELFRVIATIGQPGGGSTNHGHSLLHDGYLAVVRYAPGGVEFYDLSNPYRPELVTSITSGMGDLSEPHTFAQTTAYGGKHVILLRGPGGLGGTGIGIWDWTDIHSPSRLVAYDIPGVPGGYATGLFWMFYQAPYVYCGAGSLGLYVVDASDPRRPVVAAHLPKSETGGFNVVNTLVVGNLLIATNSDGGSGFARFDISDPVDPVLLQASANTPIPYGAQLNGNKLLIPAVSGPVSSPTGGNGVFRVHDLAVPGFPMINEEPLPSRGGSAVVQDGFAHVAASTSYVKIDVSDPADYRTVGTARVVNSGGDIDWVTVAGNLALLGDDQGFGTQIIPHASLPDSTGPAVTMVVPADNSVGQAITSRVGLTMSDLIDFDSIDPSAFIVRPVGGAPLSGSFSNQFGIVNFSPSEPLETDTTYLVEVPAGGLRDWSGNPTAVAFRSRFSTGGTLAAVNVQAAAVPPHQPGQSVAFDVSAASGPGTLRFSWDFGDGTPATPLSTATAAAHTYGAAGHYSVVVTATNGTLTATDSFLATVHEPVTAVEPTRSSTVVMDEVRRRVWCVNADNDTVTAIDADTFGVVFEVGVDRHPRTLAQASDGTIWVVCEEDAVVLVLDPNRGERQARIDLPVGSAPFGVCMSPDGSAAYVSLSAVGRVALIDPVARTVLGQIAVGPEPKGLAVAADSERVFVTRFRSGRHPLDAPVGEVYEISAAQRRRVATHDLAFDPGPDTEAGGRGQPNYLRSCTVSPDGRRLWVPSKKDNTARGMWRSGEVLTFESTVRTIASQIDLVANAEDLAARVDFNDRDLAAAVAFSPLGDYAFHVLQGSNAVDVRDVYSGAIVAGVDGTGLAPDGLVISADGSRLYVHNFMSRSLAVYDVSGVTSSTDFSMPALASVKVVARERLSAEVLLGKQIFYNAADPRMNEDGYISCASCHLDGGDDGQVWDFTDRGEGLRNTISLRGHAGTAQGNVHWTANFDEIQDFENDIRGPFGGTGFMTNARYSATVAQPLGHPKAGLSPELDALSAYVSSLVTFGRSPHRDPGGALTAAGARGRTLFSSLGCAQCHSGPDFSDSATGALHDVGTLRSSSGSASGGPLTGLDTPTLRGLWATAPYLHDGSAPTLMHVIRDRNKNGRHGAMAALNVKQLHDLVAYLQQIDDLEPAPR